MGKRTTSRRLAMQALYQSELTRISADEALENCVLEQNFTPESVDFARALIVSTNQNITRIDALISSHSQDWKVERMSYVDRNILRVAVNELLSGDETPVPVVIDEAVELAKKYGSQESGKFINGVLGGVVRDLGRQQALDTD